MEIISPADKMGSLLYEGSVPLAAFDIATSDEPSTDAESYAPETPRQQSGGVTVRSELYLHGHGIGQALLAVGEDDPLVLHGNRALKTFDELMKLIAGQNVDINGLLGDARSELLDAYMASLAERHQVSFALLRGVMEGLFSALFYRQQTMSLNLWSSGSTHHMVHQFLGDKHEFYLYYKRLFEDERFTNQYKSFKYKSVVEEANKLYDQLSCAVHKKSPALRGFTSSAFEISVERLFRVVVCLLEREEDVPILDFPDPPSFVDYIPRQSKSIKPKKEGVI